MDIQTFLANFAPRHGHIPANDLNVPKYTSTKSKKMKKIIFMAASALLLAACSGEKGHVKINLPEDFNDSTLVVSHVIIDNMFNAKQPEDVVVVYDTLRVENGVASLKLDPAGAAQYMIYPPVTTLTQPEFYANPGDNLTIDIKSFEPRVYTAEGTELMKDITDFLSATTPVRQEYIDYIRNNDEVTPEQAKELLDRYDASVKQFVNDHPKSQAIPYAILELSSDDFKACYDNMTPEAKKSILMPYADLYNRDVEEMLKEQEAVDARKAEVASGKLEAPAFTLPDLNGKKVSLSDFRGKWVVLDFWGSWCGWCVKGFPALKDAYKKYGDKIVVIGIGCNEPEADWRAGVKEHQLPWINLYNGDDHALYDAYNITGFPTKAIINPEGHLVDLTTGEDPSFYDRLASFVK